MIWRLYQTIRTDFTPASIWAERGMSGMSTKEEAIEKRMLSLVFGQNAVLYIHFDVGTEVIAGVSGAITETTDVLITYKKVKILIDALQLVVDRTGYLGEYEFRTGMISIEKTV
jgi:hypothetical protein